MSAETTPQRAGGDDDGADDGETADMTEDGGKRRLGRGLSALLGEEGGDDMAKLDRLRAAKSVPIEQLSPGKFQPRRSFDDEAMESLIESVRAKGIIQPILVRRRRDEANAYEIIAGERRWRAAQKAQLHEVPVVIRDVTDRDALEIALIENIQRQDLTALEEAEGYGRLMEEFKHTQEELAEAVGKSRSHIANTLRLLALPTDVKALVQSRQLSAGHARAAMMADDPMAVARKVMELGLNVRAAEELARGGRPSSKRVSSFSTSQPGRPSQPGQPKQPQPALHESIVDEESDAAPDTDEPTTLAEAFAQAAPRNTKDADTLALERSLSNLLGLAVSIDFDGASGQLSIYYMSLEQLDDVLNRLSGGTWGKT